MNKKLLSERDICSKFITPALGKAGWDLKRQVKEEVSFTDGRIILQGKLYARGKRKRAYYIQERPHQNLGYKTPEHYEILNQKLYFSVVAA